MEKKTVGEAPTALNYIKDKADIYREKKEQKNYSVSIENLAIVKLQITSSFTLCIG